MEYKKDNGPSYGKAEEASSSSSFPPFATPPYPPFSQEVLDAQTQQANYGILKQLEGVWVNHNPDNNKTGWGLHATPMPSPGTNSETIFGIFHFVCADYTEELTFNLVPGGVRNRGGTNEQFVGAVKYNQSIRRIPDLVGIHEENGMYLWLNEMYTHPVTKKSKKDDKPNRLPLGAKGEDFVPPYSIARSGTIPHGNSILIDGGFIASAPGASLVYPTGTDSWTQPFLGQPWPPRSPSSVGAITTSPLTVSPTMGGTPNIPDPFGKNPPTPLNLDQPPPAWMLDPAVQSQQPNSNLAYFQRILKHPLYPYSVRPDLRLRDALGKQRLIKYDFIQLSSRHQGGPEGGINNIPFVQRFANAKEMVFNLWIQTVEEEDGQQFQQLQYEQIIIFEFMVGSNGGQTRWPHIQINTLRRKVEPAKKK